MKYTRGWSNVKGYRCRAAHRVELPVGHVVGGLTRAICGAPIRTLVRPKGAPTDFCDWCDKVAARQKVRITITTGSSNRTVRMRSRCG